VQHEPPLAIADVNPRDALAHVGLSDFLLVHCEPLAEPLVQFRLGDGLDQLNLFHRHATSPLGTQHTRRSSWEDTHSSRLDVAEQVAHLTRLGSQPAYTNRGE